MGSKVWQKEARALSGTSSSIMAIHLSDSPAMCYSINGSTNKSFPITESSLPSLPSLSCGSSLKSSSSMQLWQGHDWMDCFGEFDGSDASNSTYDTFGYSDQALRAEENSDLMESILLEMHYGRLQSSPIPSPRCVSISSGECITSSDDPSRVQEAMSVQMQDSMDRDISAPNPIDIDDVMLQPTATQVNTEVLAETELLPQFPFQAVAGLFPQEDLTELRLIHLLLASAVSFSSSSRSDVTAVILERLREMVSLSGNTIQRVAAYFCDAMQFLVDGISPAAPDLPSSGGSLCAFEALQNLFPYAKFGYFSANQAILEVAKGERRLHIIDYDVMEGLQWPSLMQDLAARPEGPPYLRITALTRPCKFPRGLVSVDEAGENLSRCAAALNLPFSFQQAIIQQEDDEFLVVGLNVVDREPLVVNCMLHLLHASPISSASVSSFFNAMQKLSPKLIALVEEELTTSIPHTFVGYFVETLEHYYTIFDSLDAIFSCKSTQFLAEGRYLAHRIYSALTNSSYRQQGQLVQNRDFTGTTWRKLILAGTFRKAAVSGYNRRQAKLLLGMFTNEYGLDQDENKLLLKWKCKPLVSASFWSC